LIGQSRASSKVGWARVAAAAVALVAVALPTTAQGRPQLETGFLDVLYGSPDPAVRDQSFGRTVAARAGLVRLNVFWSSVGASKPTDPRNPADPAYDWGTLDSSVADARERGLRVLLTVTSAPSWAEGEDRPAGVSPGSWKPQPNAFGDFAHAVAERYSGDFMGLPRVKDYQAWNEPNLDNHLSPQYEGGNQFSAGHYKRMLNAFWSGIKGVHASNRVVTGGTGPYGDRPGGDRTRPLAFWRKVLCLKDRKRLRPKRCPAKAKFDVLAHHPINTSGGPRRSAIHPDDASTPDVKHLRKILRKAEKAGRVSPRDRHPLWATEIWWESKPPDRCGVRLRRHARYVAESLYLLWKQGVSTVVWLSLRDDPSQANECGRDQLQSGLELVNGKRKPAFEAFRFPFVTDRKSRTRLVAWGKSPAAGRVVVERKRGKKWRRVKAIRAGEGNVFRTKLRIRGRAKLRARVGGEASLTWKQKR
jgi:hypothetical protein